MKLFYCISILLLLLSFFLYRKTNDYLSFISEIICTICMFICYNTFVVYFLSFFSIEGNLLLYGLINMGVALFLIAIIIIKKNIQKYRFDRREVLLFCIIIIIISSVAFFRNQGLSVIKYETIDSAIHYKHALTFTDNLTLFNEFNSKDIIYGNFNRTMPIFYINAGLFMKIFDSLDSWQSFMLVDSLFYIFAALVFFVTILEMFGKDNKKGIYLILLELLYSFGFLLNSFLFGFCYLTLSIMIINLLFLMIVRFNNCWNEFVVEKIVIMFLICFAVFFSYYLFVPSIYLALGIYYIYLYKNKKILFKELILYGFITLILPFVLGFYYFIFPTFIVEKNSILSTISLGGKCYSNITPVIFSIVILWLLELYKRNGSNKLNNSKFLILNIYINTVYLFILLVIAILKSGYIYYPYKVLYVHFLFEIIFIGEFFLKYKKVFIGTCMFIIVIVMFESVCHFNILSKNIYSWNVKHFSENYISFNKGQIDVIKESIKYKDVCEYNNEFPVIGSSPTKGIWIYSMMDSIPIINHRNSDHHQFESKLISYDEWTNLDNYRCLICFKESGKLEYNVDFYDVLFENRDGIIIKKID